MKITIVTSTRADWGLLTPLAVALRDADGVVLSIVATNMHLSERYGMTVNEIEDAGFTVAARVPLPDVGDDAAGCVLAMAACTAGMAEAFGHLQPDAVIVLGDRYEMLGVASAAAIMRIPLVHIAGGTISEGAIDDKVRHAITKLADLHLVETDEARRRVIQMGEHPDTVVTTGALGVYNIMHQPLLSPEALADSLDGFRLDGSDSVLVTYHPATAGDLDPATAIDVLISALDRFADLRILFTYPNNDAGSRPIIDSIEAYAAKHPERVKAVRSLGMVRYLSALRCVRAVVGNSSSGIVEVPSMHIPTVDIGPRQQGRLCSDSVLHCPDNSVDAVADTIAYALSPTGQQRAQAAVNPYYKPDTVQIMVKAIMHFLHHSRTQKTFFELFNS